MNKAETASRHAFMPNWLGYCGPFNKGKNTLIYDYLIQEHQDLDSIKRYLQKFEVMFPYMQLIAESNSLEPFDESVGEAYWLGSKLLESVPKEKIREMILQKFVGPKKLPQSVAEYYASCVSADIQPHHSFHVLSVLSVSGKVKPTISRIDSCRISWGKVLEKSRRSFTVKYKPVEFADGKYFFRKEAEKKIGYILEGKSSGFVSAEPGDTISFHWNFACQRISAAQLHSLEYYTQKNMDALNNLHKSALFR